jgi:hypothetical protein
MALVLHHVTLSDGPAIAGIYGKAFADSPLYTVLHPGQDAQSLSSDFLSRWEGMYTKPGGFYIAAKDTQTDRLVAFVRYMKVNPVDRGGKRCRQKMETTTGG